MKHIDSEESVQDVTVHDMLEGIKYAYGINHRIISLLLRVSQQAVRNWDDGRPIAKRNLKSVSDLYDGAKLIKSRRTVLAKEHLDAEVNGTTIRNEVIHRRTVIGVVQAIVGSDAPYEVTSPEQPIILNISATTTPESCGVCMFVFRADGTLECHRYPPPWRNSVIDEDDWCGEFKERMRK